MTVIVGKKAYKVSKKMLNRLLEIASENVKFGIYAIRKNNTVEMRNDKCKSTTKLKELTRQFKNNGYKVYSNKGD